jgi:hypothetical protein
VREFLPLASLPHFFCRKSIEFPDFLVKTLHACARQLAIFSGNVKYFFSICHEGVFSASHGHYSFMGGVGGTHPAIHFTDGAGSDDGFFRHLYA